jgi:hypothetical protein
MRRVAAVHLNSQGADQVMNVTKRSAAAGATGLALAISASAAMAATPKFPAFGGPPSKDNPVVKPTEIVYSGDGSQFFAGKKESKRAGKLHWTVWNGTEGLGTGYQWIDNCNPSCANGKFSLAPVSLKVYRPRHESKYYIFTRLKVTYTGTRHRKGFTWTVSYSDGFFQI